MNKLSDYDEIMQRMDIFRHYYLCEAVRLLEQDPRAIKDLVTSFPRVLFETGFAFGNVGDISHALYLRPGMRVERDVSVLGLVNFDGDLLAVPFSYSHLDDVVDWMRWRLESLDFNDLELRFPPYDFIELEEIEDDGKRFSVEVKSNRILTPSDFQEEFDVPVEVTTLYGFEENPPGSAYRYFSRGVEGKYLE